MYMATESASLYSLFSSKRDAEKVCLSKMNCMLPLLINSMTVASFPCGK